jgi:hypothetical protein
MVTLIEAEAKMNPSFEFAIAAILSLIFFFSRLTQQGLTCIRSVCLSTTLKKIQAFPIASSFSGPTLSSKVNTRCSSKGSATTKTRSSFQNELFIQFMETRVLKQ